MSYDEQRKAAEAAASPEHQNLVRALVDYLNKNGWKVTHAAGISGYPAPWQVDKYMPDVIAQSTDGVYAFGEAETCDTIMTEHTAAQIEEFSTRTMKNDGATIPCYVVVPKICFGRLEELLRTKFPNRGNIKPLHYS